MDSLKFYHSNVNVELLFCRMHWILSPPQNIDPNLFNIQPETSVCIEWPSMDPTWSLDEKLLPNDVALHIASMLQVAELCALGSCSRFWRQLCASDLLWISLSRERWPNMDFVGDPNCSHHGKEKGRSKESEHQASLAPEGWRAFYIKWHIEMAERAVSVVEFVRQNARHESLEVGDYQRAMELLCTMKLGFKDVQLYLFRRKHSVVLNLIALHYSLASLGVQREYLKAALAMGQIADRHICLRWWSLGHWVYGFRRGDEVHVHITSLMELLNLEQQELLHVIQRGTVHEVLRVQISADFRTSAWIDRDMHSQR